LRAETRIRRSLKAVSPVISVLLMIAIAVAASLIAYAWVMGYMGFTTNKVGKAIMIQSAAPGAGGMDVFVQNVGQSAVTLDPGSSVYINDELQNLPLGSIVGGTTGGDGKTTLNPGETATIHTGHAWGEGIKVKIVTTDGTFTEISNYSGGSSSSALVLTIDGSGSVAKNPDQVTYQVGASVQLTANPSAGWFFAGWSGDITTSDNPATLIIDENPEVTATFSQTAYTLTVTPNPTEGGTVDYAGGPYHLNDVVTLTANPATGYDFTQWEGDLTGTTSPADLTITGNMIVTADFTLETFPITVTAGSGGQILLNGNPVSGTVNVNYGESPTFVISPITGYYIDDVSVDTVSQGPIPSYQFINVQENHQISATFALSQQVTFVAVGTGSGSSSGNVTPAYPSGLQANDLVLLSVVVKGDSPAIDTPAGFNLLFGPDSSGTSGTARVTQAIYYRFFVVGDTGTVTVHITQTTTSGRGARMYAFRNVALSSFTEGGGVGTAHSNHYAAQTVTTLGVKRLAVSFEAIGDNPGLGSFAGETGGDWQLTPAGNWFNGAYGSNFDIAVQTATLTNNPGTITGGTDSHSTCDWIVRSFALIPR
jgi:uncharacterized repeat protein (TIGR02543 family)